MRIISMCALSVAVCLIQESAHGDITNPSAALLEGGVRFVIHSFYETEPLNPRVYFGDVEATGIYTVSYVDDENLGDQMWLIVGVVPPNPRPGRVDVLIIYDRRGLDGVILKDIEWFFPDSFTYYGETTIQSISPPVYSLQPSGQRVTLWTRGVSDAPETAVYFGEHAATDVEVEILGDRERVTCLPPPFPGGAYPLVVDVRVESPFATAVPLSGAFQYDAPVIADPVPTVPAWTLNAQTVLSFEQNVSGPLSVYVDGLPASVATAEDLAVTIMVPALPPGLYPLVVTASNGGQYTDAIEYTGTPSTDFHPGDRDQDFRFNLSEVLRVVQFFNAGGIHCDATSEDGYAPGVGSDTSCTPYPADNAPFDWNLGLTELLGIIQFYNLHCYQPCPGAPGTYCPPD